MKNLTLFAISAFTVLSLIGQEAVLVKDINPGAENGTPYLFKEYNGMLLFSATDTVYNRELWISDGTESGTLLLKEIKPDPVDGSFPGELIEMNGLLYFDAKEYSQDRTLWVTDGTTEGTQEVLDTTALEYIHWGMETNNGHLYFSGGPGSSYEELWISDGTSDGTYMLKDINPGDAESAPRNFIPLNSKLFFFANQEGYGSEPWITDGTEEGTFRLKDINPGEGHSMDNYSSPGILYHSKIYFLAFDSIHGTELWITDGTSDGTTLFKEIIPGSTGGFKHVYPHFFVFDDHLFFTANDTVHGAEIWYSDGTPEGTQLFEDYSPGEEWSSPGRFSICNGKLFFFASSPEHGSELRVLENSSSNIQLVKDVVSGPESLYAIHLTSYQGNLFFAANDGTNGYELWTSDGTSAGTQKSTPQNATNTDPLGEYNFYGFGTHNGYVYFSANYDDHGAELYKVESPLRVLEKNRSEILELGVYPNPTSGTAFAKFTLQQTSRISFYLNSIEGKRISRLIESDFAPGEHNISIQLPNQLPPGLYLIEARTSEWSTTVKLVKQ